MIQRHRDARMRTGRDLDDDALDDEVSALTTLSGRQTVSMLRKRPNLVPWRARRQVVSMTPA
jgi:hypothetical protein